MKVQAGFGYCLTTYKQDNPQELASFEGEPFLVPIKTSLEETMEIYWEHLDPDWRVAIAGKRIDRYDNFEIKIKNRFEEVL